MHYRKYKNNISMQLFAILLFSFILLILPISLDYTNVAFAHHGGAHGNPLAEQKANVGDGASILGPIENGFKAILYAILVFFGWVANAATIIFGLFTDASIFQSLFARGSEGSQIMLSMWAFVRDFLNIFFILILLFSAFSTIFQVEKFHLRKTLLMLVIMALLVNFSWPITLVIIDAGNVIMYFFLNNIFPNGNVFAGISAESGVAEFIVPQTLEIAQKNPTSYLILAIVFMFLLAITLLTIALLFLIRVVIFIILLIFSPVAFVAAILPSTQQFSSMWWDNLFKWTFIGPIMVFMLSLSLKFMSSLKNTFEVDGLGTDQIAPETSIGGGVELFSNITITTAAIVIMWAGIIAANKMGGGVAGIATGQATKFAKWGGQKVRGGALRGVRGTTKMGLKSAKGVGRAANAGTARIPGLKGRTIGSHITSNKYTDKYDATKKKLFTDPAKKRAAAHEYAKEERQAKRDLRKEGNFKPDQEDIDIQIQLNIDNARKVAHHKKQIRKNGEHQSISILESYIRSGNKGDASDDEKAKGKAAQKHIDDLLKRKEKERKSKK